MQRCCSRLGRTLLSSSSRRHLSLSSSGVPNPAPLRPTIFPNLPLLRLRPPLPPLRYGVSVMQMRGFAGKKAKDRSRAPTTPVVSKLKKYKMKAPSAMKFRFKTLNDGTIRRWRAGKRHNAHLKSKIAKRRLRKPALVHPAYAKVIKKLHFCGIEIE